MRSLPRIVAESPVGKDVDVRIIRKGKPMDVTVRLGRLEDGDKLAATETASGGEQPPAATATALGLTFGELDEARRKQFGIGAEISGVVITDVQANSAAAEKQVLAGEVITEIAQETVKTAQDVLDRVDALKKQGRKNALLMIASKTGELRFVTIRID